ncbi:hypothetical protein PSE_0878 [Pseudovibrio sp. FO-BEG1]|nr:hypothetical protein PSE_0878 [Pseudovibrio sp. FO-BEG1]
MTDEAVAGERAYFTQHGVYQNPVLFMLDDEGCVAKKVKFHPDLPLLKLFGIS